MLLNCQRSSEFQLQIWLWAPQEPRQEKKIPAVRHFVFPMKWKHLGCSGHRFSERHFSSGWLETMSKPVNRAPVRQPFPPRDSLASLSQRPLRENGQREEHWRFSNWDSTWGQMRAAQERGFRTVWLDPAISTLQRNGRAAQPSGSAPRISFITTRLLSNKNMGSLQHAKSKH